MFKLRLNVQFKESCAELQKKGNPREVQCENSEQQRKTEVSFV